MDQSGCDASRSIIHQEQVFMRVLKSSFVWQFAGGFVLGAVGLFALQPASASIAPVATANAATVAPQR